MELSLLMMTVSVATLCVAIVLLAATSINRSRLDAMTDNEASKSLEQRLAGLARSHEELAASVTELKAIVQSIMEKLNGQVEHWH
jgi:two-component sensor histidine kinase